MKLHEIELYVKDTVASKKFYRDVLGLKIKSEEKKLLVYNSGLKNIDLDTSNHYPGEISLSFLVKDLEKFVQKLGKKGIPITEPMASHLGMRAIILYDPDGHRIEIQAPGESSPEWLKKMV